MPVSMEDMMRMSQAIAESKMFGVQTPSEALSLMLLCQAEGLHPAMAVRRYHIIERKPSMRADALQGEFELDGAILWHERTDMECSATFFKDKRKVTDAATDRARERYKRLKVGHSVADLAQIGELTIIRTFQDAMDKKVAQSFNKETREWKIKHNWKQSPRQMLHARCLSEGARAIAPGLIAGIYVEDEEFDHEALAASTMTAEDRVRQATANRTGESDEIPMTHAGDQTAPTEIIINVTEENYGDVVCHVGQANGNMLGKKVSELKPPIIKWLVEHFGSNGKDPAWGSEANGKDSRLKEALDIAWRKLNE